MNEQEKIKVKVGFVWRDFVSDGEHLPYIDEEKTKENFENELLSAMSRYYPDIEIEINWRGENNYHYVLAFHYDNPQPADEFQWTLEDNVTGIFDKGEFWVTKE